MRNRKISFVAGLAIAGLLVGACSEDSTTTTEAPVTSEAPATSDAPVATDAPADSPISAENQAHAVEYTGGTAGAATGDPYIVGYVNQEGGTPGFPEASIGVDAAVWYINNYLGVLAVARSNSPSASSPKKKMVRSAHKKCSPMIRSRLF